MTITMSPRRHDRCRRPNDRFGVATLELVMCMPILLLLMVGLVWLGFSVIGQSQVTVEARYKAWSDRFDGDSTDPLRFLEDDFSSQSATTEVNVSPLFGDVASPESSHDVGMGSWDHQATDLDQFPSWELYLTAAANAQTGGLQVAYSDARNSIRSLQNMAGQLVVEEIQNTIREMLDNPLDLFRSGADAGQQEAERKAQQQKREIQSAIRAIRNQIDATEELVDKLEEQKDEADSEDEKESLTSRIKVNKNKVETPPTRTSPIARRFEGDRLK